MDRNWRGSRPRPDRHRIAIGRARPDIIHPLTGFLYHAYSHASFCTARHPGVCPVAGGWVSGFHRSHHRPRTRPRSCTRSGGWFHSQTASSALVVEDSTIAGSHLEPTQWVSSGLLLTNQKRMRFRSRSLVCGTSGFGRNGLLSPGWLPISGWWRSWLS